ncbi:hypothetical protein SAMN02927937_02818 [Paenimyroides aquimaris]|uniref:Uncharacterized protein n=1 Tax=Paenimyroides marinum TaxID=1159016 RepID=A0A1H6MXI0_9FLAO|nr:DUF5687 family protein [Paenimyroides aquimaris]SEI02540.1 hypothetical protein SAMN02927937_02818 [Paenimyroides aquimaris]
MTFKQLANLEWKGIKRKGGMAQSIIMAIGKGYFGLGYLIIMTLISADLFEMAAEEGIDPFQGFFKYAVYLWLGDLVIRYFFQKMPTTLIKPLLIQNVRKKTIVNYCLTKSALSFFNFVNLFMGGAILLTLTLSYKVGFVTGFLFAFSFTIFLWANNFLVQLLNHVNKFAVPFLVVFAGVLALDYFKYVEVTAYTKFFFEALYNYPFLIVVVAAYLIVLLVACYRFYFKNLSLDSTVVVKKETYKYYDLNFLNRFGKLAPFLKLDLKLLTRNKRTRTVLYMSLAFLLYGLFFLLNPSGAFEGSTFVILSGIMVTGGFMLMFGQYVPSWDSSYYPLMMTQNIPYRKYLESKWLIMVLGTLVSMILASFYIYFGWNVYITIIAVGFYNIGWNCYLSLIIGAYVRTKIDLTSNKNAFGDTKAFNIKTMLLSIPTVLAPMIVYFILTTFLKFEIAIIVFIAIGLIGILLKKFMFDLIEKLYKKQKYTTLKAYK